ncbi:NAD(P)H-hydrate dehydratase [Nocardioides sp. AN3]
MIAKAPEVVTPARLRSWPLSEPGVGKESRGTLLVLGGSATTPGAVRLAGEAALRSGAGKLVLATARSVTAALGVAVPEARVLGLDEDEDGSVSQTAAPAIVEAAAGADALLLGPGLADPDAAVALLSAILPRVEGPVAIDALGTAYLTAHPDGLAHLEGAAVVTANIKELALMLQREEDETAESTAEAALELAQRAGAVVVAGGEGKHIAAPDGRVWVVEGGGPGLGVSGSGDVQAGIAAGLLARGEEPAKAAVWAAYLHARAGERLAGSVARLGYLARELPPTLPRVISEVS